MPIYVYEIIRADGRPGRRFEITQPITARALKKHPETGQAVRRVFTPPALPKDRFHRTVHQFKKEDLKKAEAKLAQAEKAVKKKKQGLKGIF